MLVSSLQAKKSYVYPQQWDVRGSLEEDSGVAEGGSFEYHFLHSNGSFEYHFIFSTVTLYLLKCSKFSDYKNKSTKADQSQS